MNQTIFVLLTVLFAASIVVTVTIIKRRRKKRRTLLYLKKIWGSKDPGHERVFIPENRKRLMNSIKKEYSFFIDDITWDDLNMDKIFQRLNYTRSTVGEDFLYSMLHLPVFDDKQLTGREEMIALFQQDESLRLSLQYYLTNLGLIQETNLADWLYGSPFKSSIRILPFIGLVLLLLISPLFIIINPGLGIIMMVMTMIINITVHAKTIRDLSVYLEPVQYLVRMIAAAGKISKIKHEALNEHCINLSALFRKLNTFSIQNFSFMQAVTQEPFTEYLKTVLLGEIIFFKNTMRELLNHQKEVREIFNILGILDSCLSIASFRDSISNWCKPDFNSGRSLVFSVKDAWHPLIDKPVPSSILMEKPVLLTGSNASGKSTWLKVCAVNILFAQTIHTCTAASYYCSYFRLFSSMALRDDIVSGESYYIVEIRSLKRILDAVDEEPAVFCVIDEVLRGTNTVERIAASSEVLQLLSGKRCLCMAATHDLELVQLLKNSYSSFHFQESITDNGIVFDYLLYPGPTKTRNAIKLLSIMDYDEELVAKAEQKAKAFMDTGIWQ